MSPDARVTAPPRPRVEAHLLGVPLFGSAIFLAAGLLFWLEPLFTKSVLPLLGGSPGVWNTALMFFQAALLAGYLYAHLGTRLLGMRRHAALHLLLLAAALFLLPPPVSHEGVAPAEGSPVLWLLGTLTVSIGLPFFVLASTSPLLQAWFATTGHPDREDPYFLYASSNAGSLLALLAFPLLLEPALGLERQSGLWATAFLVLAALTALAGTRLRSPHAIGSAPWDAQGEPTPGGLGAPLIGGRTAKRPGISWKRKVRWLLLAFAPSSLLLGVTMHLSTDVAAVPLLWVIPLALYLLTFILAFSRRVPLPWEMLLKAEAMLLVLLAVVLSERLPLHLGIGLHLFAFFVVALACHGELARDRPAAEHLTQFYLWIALGGALGGAFNVLLAPVLFDRVLEYPLAILLACALRPSRGDRAFPRRSDVLLLLLFGAAIVAFAVGVPEEPTLGRLHPGAVLLAFVGIGAFALRWRPFRFTAGVAATLLVSAATFQDANRILFTERSFFGVHRVRLDASERFNVLIHGTTIHGAQRRSEPGRLEPRTYYGEDGPVGDILVRASGGDDRRVPSAIGVVGLGTGSMACHAREGQRWTFFEIDPVVVRLATASPWFTFLEDCGGEEEIVLGDARLTLEERPARQFDLLFVDAFTSDAVPVHLLTREAMELYVSRVRAGGLVALHLSNRHMELEPVVAAAAHELGAAGWIRRYDPPTDLDRAFHSPSLWAVIGTDEEALRRVASTHRDWSPLHRRPGVRAWTDDYSNIVEVLRWGGG